MKPMKMELKTVSTQCWTRYGELIYSVRWNAWKKCEKSSLIHRSRDRRLCSVGFLKIKHLNEWKWHSSFPSVLLPFSLCTHFVNICEIFRVLLFSFVSGANATGEIFDSATKHKCVSNGSGICSDKTLCSKICFNLIIYRKIFCFLFFFFFRVLCVGFFWCIFFYSIIPLSINQGRTGKRNFDFTCHLK